MQCSNENGWNSLGMFITIPRGLKLVLAIILSLTLTFSLMKSVLYIWNEFGYIQSDVDIWLSQNGLGQYKEVFRTKGEYGKLKIQLNFAISFRLGRSDSKIFISYRLNCLFFLLYTILMLKSMLFFLT